MDRENAIRLGYIIATFNIGCYNEESWAYRRKPEFFPHDTSWFLNLPEKERSKYGIKIRINLLGMVFDLWGYSLPRWRIK